MAAAVIPSPLPSSAGSLIPPFPSDFPLLPQKSLNPLSTKITTLPHVANFRSGSHVANFRSGSSAEPNLKITQTQLVKSAPETGTTQEAQIPNLVTNGIRNQRPLGWAARFKSSLKNLQKSATPTYLDDGTPVVRASASVILKGSEMWTDYIVARFCAKPPSPAKLFADLNPVWGKFGDIVIRHKSEFAYLIYIPTKSTREWVLQVGYWQTGNCGFKVTEWTPQCSLDKEVLVSIPTWVKLSDILSELYTLEGINIIVSAIVEPIHTEHSRLNPRFNGETKVKVEIPLDRKVPELIIVEDDSGNTVKIHACYPRLPPQCEQCKEYGHMVNRCAHARKEPITQKPIITNDSVESTRVSSPIQLTPKFPLVEQTTQAEILEIPEFPKVPEGPETLPNSEEMKDQVEGNQVEGLAEECVPETQLTAQPVNHQDTAPENKVVENLVHAQSHPNPARNILTEGLPLGDKMSKSGQQTNATLDIVSKEPPGQDKMSHAERSEPQTISDSPTSEEGEIIASVQSIRTLQLPS